MLFLGFMVMFILYVVKVNCAGSFVNPIIEEFGTTKTAYTQVNTFMTVAMMIGSLFIGKMYKQLPMRFVLAGCVAVVSLTFIGMSRATELWHLYILAAIQGLAWSGATNLPATIMVGNWFGPKVKGTALSLAMLGSGAGALVWVKVVQAVIVADGWRTGYLAMAGIAAIMIPLALLLAVNMPADKGFKTRVGDPSPEEVEAAGGELTQNTGITGGQAVRTIRWWMQWAAHFLTMIGVAAFNFLFIAHLTEVFASAGHSAEQAATMAAALSATVLGTMILGKFLVGVLSDVLHIKRVAVIAPLFYVGVFAIMGMANAENIDLLSKIIIPLYLIGGAVPSTVPFLITARNFGDKEYGVLSGWMNIAGNIGQIVGPIIAALVGDITGTYSLAWFIFAGLMIVVSLLYGFSGVVSTKKITELGYTPA